MCALFFDYKATLPANTQVQHSAWHDNEPIVALALSNKEIHFLRDEGTPATEDIYRRAESITMLTWQPRGNILAVGWKDGLVSLWRSEDRTTREPHSSHKTPVTLLRWSPSGNRLISASSDGFLIVWKVDPRSNLSQCAQYRTSGSIIHCVFYITPLQKKRDANSNSSIICPSFFVGGSNGSVHYADDLGHISEVQSLKCSILSMLFYEEKSRLVLITDNLLLIQLQVNDDGSVQPFMKVKLSVGGDGVIGSTIWAGPGLLATASGESLIRLWNLASDENYVLNLSTTGPSAGRGDRILCIDYNPKKRMLVAGTRDGDAVFWKFLGTSKENNCSSQESWEYMTSRSIRSKISKVKWGPIQSVLVAETDSGVYTLNEAYMQRSLHEDVAVIQIGPQCASIEQHNKGSITQCILDSSIRIRGLAHDGKSLVLWSGDRAETYEIENGEVRHLCKFACSSSSLALYGDSLYISMKNTIDICNLQGTIKQTISFTEGEGEPSLLAINKKYLAVATTQGLIKAYDISRRPPKVVGSPGKFQLMESASPDGFIIKSIECNVEGTKVSIVVDEVEPFMGIRTPCTSIFVYDLEQNSFCHYNFGKNRYPVSHYWDPEESRLIACETHLNKSPQVKEQENQDKEVKKNEELPERDEGESKTDDLFGPKTNGLDNDEDKNHEIEVTTLFSTMDSGLQMQDQFELNKQHDALLGVHIPRLFFVAKRDEKTKNSDSKSLLRMKVMRDFVGLDKVDDEARKALMDFSYYMTIGNMDEAYKSVKLIENPSVWENMAHMCVKTKRLDVAEVCLGNMGHARGAAAVRDAHKEPELEARVAMVAIQLGLLDDAARLYRECGRYDLLGELYQASGFWSKNITIASQKNRIDLRRIHYQYANHLEETGNIDQAISHYEKSRLHARDVPRMLFGLKQMDELKCYVKDTDDSRLQIWWAQYFESNQQYEKALHFYHRGKDYLSLVRVHCLMNEFEEAAEIVRASENKAASYHLARQLEGVDNIQDAVFFYAKSNCYNHAIRLCKAKGLDGDLMHFALQSKKSEMLECAEYFEQKQQYDKSVQLYQKGGNITKALNLCFKAELFDMLHNVAEDLGNETSPSVLKRCADFFIENRHYDKAVNLLIKAHRVNDALDLCMDKKVKLSEEMAEQLTPEKSDDPIENNKRNEMLRKMAKCLKHQGSFHLATKKYTQSGDKIKAMKCLLKSGDTEKIIFFANVSRTNENYILTANYLQNLEWRTNPEIMNSIVTFYTKAKAYDQLASFYDACAQLEIDEYRDYAKALDALRNAIQYVNKSRSLTKDDTLEALQRRIHFIQQFVEARELSSSDPEGMIRSIRELLEQPDVERCIRIGDAYGVLVEYYYKQRNMDQAYQYVEKMRQKKIILKPYIDEEILKEIHKIFGEPLKPESSKNHERMEIKHDDDDVEEDIDEELENSENDKRYRK